MSDVSFLWETEFFIEKNEKRTRTWTYKKPTLLQEAYLKKGVISDVNEK